MVRRDYGDWKNGNTWFKKCSSKEHHLTKKIMEALKSMWSIGKREFEGDSSIRMILFGSVITGIILYRTEVWDREKQIR